MARRSYLHRYGTHPEQEADLVLPGGDAPARVVVLLHGGFWRERYRRDLMAPLAADLADRGIASLNVEFRRLDCGGGWPTTVQDVRAAIRSLRALGHEPAVAVGHSAGGHLALLVADEVDAVVAQAAVTDVAEGIRQRLGEDGDVVARFVGAAPLAECSPVERAPLPVPVLLVHGTEDVDVPPVFSERLAARGGDVTLDLREGEDHFVFLDPTSDAWTSAVAWMRRRAGV